MPTPPNTYGNWKVATLIAGQSSIDSTWTEADFAALALACLDQAGLTLDEYRATITALDDADLVSDELYQELYGEPRRRLIDASTVSATVDEGRR